MWALAAVLTNAARRATEANQVALPPATIKAAAEEEEEASARRVALAVPVRTLATIQGALLVLQSHLRFTVDVPAAEAASVMAIRGTMSGAYPVRAAALCS